MIKDSKIYNNKNGYYTDEELLEFKYMSDDEFIDFLRGYNNMRCKCPPLKYALADCFHCIPCMKAARNAIKEKKGK